MHHFVQPKEVFVDQPMHVDFHRKLAWQLIDKQWLIHEVQEGNNHEEGIEERHQAVTAPQHAKEFRNCRWVCSAVGRYQQYVCKAKGCKKQVRTCCSCKKGYWLCDSHLMDHAAKHSKIG